MNNVEKRVYLYGLDEEYRLVRYTSITDEYLTISNIQFSAKDLKTRYPSIVMVFAVDNKYGVYRAYKDLSLDNSVENRVLFKIELETNGIRII